MQFLDFGTLIFIVAAVVIFLRLRSVLGQRTGHERPPHDPYSAPEEQAADNVVALPKRRAAEADGEVVTSEIDQYAKPGTPLHGQLTALRQADPAFSPRQFVEGAKLAYEMIVLAFADGDRKTLKSLLSRDVYDGFVAAIAEREKRGEKLRSTFVGIRDAAITGVEMRGTEAFVTMRIVSEMISSTIAADESVIDGDPDQVEEVKDVWTFVRDTRNRDPNWKLDATEDEE